jgi:hypothetical protein
MRIAVIAISEGQSERLKNVAKAMEREFHAMGHQCEYVKEPGPALSMFDFIVLCSEPLGLLGKIGTKIHDSLSGKCNLSGKRALAVLLKGGLASGKALAALMNAMEREGMVVVMGELVSQAREAATIARDAPLVRG